MIWRRACTELLPTAPTEVGVAYLDKEGILKETQFGILLLIDAFTPEE